jgi:hypothetical protein
MAVRCLSLGELRKECLTDVGPNENTLAALKENGESQLSL